MKYIFTIINLFLIAAMAWSSVDILYKKVVPADNVLPEEFLQTNHKKKTGPPQIKPVYSRDKYKIIVKRNLFKVDIEKKEISAQNQEIKDKDPEKLEPTKLKLVLWGTVTGDTKVYAVIEDKKLRHQSLYQVGDKVQAATIKNILRREVILTFQGKDQVLEMGTRREKISGTGMAEKKINSGPALVKKIMPVPLQNNIEGAIKQIKFRPHFSEGEADGLMVYGIRPQSIFRQIGLRNGDIIKDINGTPIISAEDASSLFRQIEDAGDARITLFRRGRLKELVFQTK